jgi:hypothetical protein
VTHTPDVHTIVVEVAKKHGGEKIITDARVEQHVHTKRRATASKVRRRAAT